VTSTGPLIGVLALQGDVREHLKALEACGARAIGVRRPEELAAVDGLVIPGGESTTIAKLAVIFDLMDALRERVAAGMPTYGSCAGMILLADRITASTADQQTIGGLDVTVRRNAFGRQVESFEADVNIEGINDGPVRAVFIRAPWVEQTGDSVQVLGQVNVGAEDTAGVGRIVAVRQGQLLATSFHPELTGDLRVHAYFASMVGEYADQR
jgi:5'-phosphate synthase pdxT subunit